MLACAAILVVSLATVVGYRLAYADRVFPGVAARGIELGGLTRGEAYNLLSARTRPIVDTPLIVEAGGKQWRLARASLGARFDVERVVASAFALGRTGYLLSDVTLPFALRLSPRDLDQRVNLGDADWKSALDPIAAAVDRPAVPARLVIGPNHRATITPDSLGTRLDRIEARRLIVQALLLESTDRISLPVIADAPRLTAADQAGARDQVTTLIDGPVQVSYADRTWFLPLDEIERSLIMPGSSGAGTSTTVQIDERLLNRFVDEIATEVDQAPRNAVLALAGDRYIVRPGQSARKVDRVGTVSRLAAGLFSGDRSVAAVVVETPPDIGDDALATALSRANTIVESPLLVQGPEQATWTITTASLRQMMIVPDPHSLKTGDTPRLDSARVAAFVAKIANELNRTPVNARFQRDPTGAISVTSDGLPGLTVVQEDTVARILDASAGVNRSLGLVVNTIQPSVTAATASSLNALDLIAENTTSYVGSIPPRRHNVELATSLLNGVVLGPGEIFSFNHELGATTLDRGFQVGYGIQAQGDAVKTVPSVAGGICQVATTLFQPVFWEGYTIEERYSHAYWIAHYISHGDVGLDTTVDEEAGLDFRFKNDTTSPLLIQSSTDGSSVHFALYGVAPVWTVKVDPPVISKIVKTDPTPVLQPDPTLLKGQQIIAEAAQDGFLAVVHRTVTDAAGNARELFLRSSYAPSHNVTLVGTKT